MLLAGKVLSTDDADVDQLFVAGGEDVAGQQHKRHHQCDNDWRQPDRAVLPDLSLD